MTLKWIDVQPSAWYYRDVLELDRLRLSTDPYQHVIEGIGYNVFEDGKPRIVKTFIATDNQREFIIDGYTPSPDNPMIAYVDGIRAMIDDVQPNKAILANPCAGGLEVTFMAAGVPKMQTDQYPCSSRPSDSGLEKYPRVDLANKGTYTFNIYYHYNESCVVFSKMLKRVDVTLNAGETVDDALSRVIDTHDDQFTIIDGTLYVPYSYNEIPMDVCYNYKDGDDIKYVCERVIPTSPSGTVLYNDRFFPDTELVRFEFFVILHRFRQNFYNRFTDRTFNTYGVNERNIPDIDPKVWYAEQVFDVLNEKFLDGCYVFPLYDDGTFKPTACITRAESVLYLNRFIEWTLEKFR
jgi:hypothetical protein